MATTPLSLFLLSLLLSLSLYAQAQTPAAPAPTPSGPVNFTAVLEKGGQFVTLIRLLNKTQTLNQIDNQLNSSSEGMTVFAPTDNAFNNLKAGALNDLSQQEQASGPDGVWGLNFTGQSNQVNVSTGLVLVQINNALRQDFPLAVYPVDKVLLPEALFGVKPPSASPPAPSSKSNATEAAAGPTTDNNAAGGRNVALGLVVGLGLVCIGILS
ncbi:fasciclin arabinogalactan protein [Salix suchowensis]|nr:fasciclin arabinogalactan protein [Salix suchowensis]